MSNDVQSAVTVTLNIGLDTVIGYGMAYGRDGEPEPGSPITLADAVAVELARMMVSEMKDVVNYRLLRDRLSDGIDEAIEQQVTAAMNQRVQRTTDFGTPIGEPTTLAEQIAQSAEKWFTQTSKKDYRSEAKTNARRLIDDAVERGLAAEVNRAINDAKAEALEKVKTAAAKVFADQMAKTR